jgi:DNA-binding CsgD family transcriptional regulator/tetratricopeptide (TPR) repeat protein
MNIGDIHRSRGELDEALECFERGFVEVEAVPFPRFKCMLLIALAQIAMARHNDEEATDRLHAAMAVAGEVADTYAMGLALEHLARHCLQLGRVDRAHAHAVHALELASESGERPREMEAERLLSDCCEAGGDMTGALEHYRRHAGFKEEVMSAERQRSMQGLQMRSEIERAEKEREIYRLKSEQLEMTIGHKTKELGTLALHLVEKNGVLESLRRDLANVVPMVSGEARTALRGALRTVEANIASERDWEAFETQFELLHHDFIASLSRRHPDLTRTELKVCALLKVNLSTKEIANLLSTSMKTVETHRYRIRKKLGLAADVHLGKHLVTEEGE